MRVQLLTLMMLLALLAGCVEDNTTYMGTTEDGDLLLPSWEVGDSWVFTFTTPQFGQDTARLVVAEEDDGEGNYIVGISSEREAQRHAVINHNPFLGRINQQTLGVYEQGEVQSVFSFPWEYDTTWSFSLFGEDWTSEVVSIYDKEIRVEATSSSGHVLKYTFSSTIQFLTTFEWVNDEGESQLKMVVSEVKSGYNGDIFFYRARDLLDSTYDSNDQDVYDSFFDSGHPDGSEWDVLVWYIDARISNGGQGSLAMKDRTGASPLLRAWGSGATEQGAIGTIPSITGEYTLTVQLRGAESNLHLRVAGALSFHWTL
ncbi:MAG: hypothetical protein O3A74_01805 [archaeon]|nr:hypothetical protein [archaeon]